MGLCQFDFFQDRHKGLLRPFVAGNSKGGAPGQPARFAVVGEHTNYREQTRLFPITSPRGNFFMQTELPGNRLGSRLPANTQIIANRRVRCR